MNEYADLITSEHRTRSRFVATAELLTGVAASIRDAALSLPAAFDLDVAAGAQLDAVGKWVGISRNQNIPVESAYFSFDTADLGWDQANWNAPFGSVEGITILDDETYRAVIKAKIGANYWDGTNQGSLVIGQSAFAGLGVQCFLIDNQDMTVTVYILGAPTALLIELIKRGVVPPIAAGVRVASYILASVSGAPLFALSAPTTPITAGLDFGSFGDPV